MPIIIRKLHLLFGLFSIPFILVYAISAVFFVHPEIDPSTTKTVIQELDAKLYGNDGEKWITQLLEKNNIRGQIIAGENHADGSSLTMVIHPGKQYEIALYPADNHIEIKEKTDNLTGFLKSLHKTSGFNSADQGVNAWGIYIFIEALLLLLIVFTGIWLWLQRSRDRISGLIFLLTSMLFGVGMLAIIRLG